MATTTSAATLPRDSRITDMAAAQWEQNEHDEPDQGTFSALAAVANLAAGLALLALVFANLSRLTDWADQYGTVWVYLGFFLVLSIAGRVFWKGADTLIARLIRGSH